MNVRAFITAGVWRDVIIALGYEKQVEVLDIDAEFDVLGLIPFSDAWVFCDGDFWYFFF